MEMSELVIDTLKPDFNVGARARMWVVGAGVIREWFTAQQAGLNIGIQFLQPSLDHFWQWTGKVEGFPRPVTKMQSQELTRKHL